MEPHVTTRQPSECTNISEVRNEIDNIDRAILELLANRFEYVKEVVKYKAKTAESIVATDRRDAVLKERRQWASELGLDPDVIEGIYSSLIQYFINEEKKIINL